MAEAQSLQSTFIGAADKADRDGAEAHSLKSTRSKGKGKKIDVAAAQPADRDNEDIANGRSTKSKGKVQTIDVAPAQDRDRDDTQRSTKSQGKAKVVDAVEEPRVQPQPLNGLTKDEGEPDRYGFFGVEMSQADSDPDLDPEIIRRREVKWIDMLGDWDKWMSKKFKKVRDRCRKGIPSAMRARAWSKLTGGHHLMSTNVGVFKQYLDQTPEPRYAEEISRDLHRNFPNHEIFREHGGFGQKDLRDLLIAYTIHNPKVGYCQAMAPVAGALLMHMPVEQAFWTFVATLRSFMKGYYNPGLEQVQIDGQVLYGLLKRTSSSAYKHLRQHSVEATLVMTEWFMCLFTRTLPWPTVLRLLDMFFCEGCKVLFWAALVIIDGVIGTADQQNECDGMPETLIALKQIPTDLTKPDVFITKCISLRLTEQQMDREHALQMAQFRAHTHAKNKKKRS